MGGGTITFWDTHCLSIHLSPLSALSASPAVYRNNDDGDKNNHNDNSAPTALSSCQELSGRMYPLFHPPTTPSGRCCGPRSHAQEVEKPKGSVRLSNTYSGRLPPPSPPPRVLAACPLRSVLSLSGSEDRGLLEPSFSLSCTYCLSAYVPTSQRVAFTHPLHGVLHLSRCQSYHLYVYQGEHQAIRVSVHASLSARGCAPPTPPCAACSHPDCRHPPTCPRRSPFPPCSPCCSWSPASSSEPGSGAPAAPPGSSLPAPCTVPPGSSCRPTHLLSPSPSSAAPCRCRPLWAQTREDRPQLRSTGLSPG